MPITVLITVAWNRVREPQMPNRTTAPACGSAQLAVGRRCSTVQVWAAQVWLALAALAVALLFAASANLRCEERLASTDDAAAIVCSKDIFAAPIHEPIREQARDADEGDPRAESSEPEVELDGVGFSSAEQVQPYRQSKQVALTRLVRNERAAGRRRSRAPPV